MGNVASTDSGRTALNGAGLWYMPNSFCFGTSAQSVPSVCWTTITVAPTAGPLRLRLQHYQRRFGWINIWQQALSGTWTPLTFGSDSQQLFDHFHDQCNSNHNSGPTLLLRGGIDINEHRCRYGFVWNPDSLCRIAQELSSIDDFSDRSGKFGPVQRI